MCGGGSGSITGGEVSVGGGENARLYRRCGMR